MEKEIIKLKDSIEALNRTSKDMKVSFHYTDNDEEIDAIKTVAEAAENYLEMKKEYKKLVNDRDLAVKTKEETQNQDLDNPFANTQIIEVNLIKNRNGGIGLSKLAFMMNINKFTEIQDEGNNQ